MDFNDVEILFAEDSKEDAMFTLRALAQSGFSNKVYHVKDGAEALDFLYCQGAYAARNPAEKPKIILLDLKMPKMTGLQVLQRIKSDPETSSIIVVILTSSKEDPDIKQCYALGANSYIVKPVDSDNFFEAIKSLGLYWMVLNLDDATS
jgi:CheY-like chemotaxis protein